MTVDAGICKEGMLIYRSIDLLIRPEFDAPGRRHPSGKSTARGLMRASVERWENSGS